MTNYTTHYVLTEITKLNNQPDFNFSENKTLNHHDIVSIVLRRRINQLRYYFIQVGER